MLLSYSFSLFEADAELKAINDDLRISCVLPPSGSVPRKCHILLFTVSTLRADAIHWNVASY